MRAKALNPRPYRSLDPARMLASWFGSGYLPRAPGTWGSLASLPFAWLISSVSGSAGLAIGAFFVFILGWFLSSLLVRRLGTQDPQWIVIDEVAGQWLTLAFAGGTLVQDPLAWAIGFITFRVADMTKPYPASWADRHVGGGLGVMLDDILAAIYSAAATWATHRYFGGK